MNKELAREIAVWHGENGGHANAGVHGHAVRMLHEVVELCIASGATVEQIMNAVDMEVKKAQERDELPMHVNESYGPSWRTMHDEVADVGITFQIYQNYTNIDDEEQAILKLPVLRTRDWVADELGVLWRPK